MSVRVYLRKDDMKQVRALEESFARWEKKELGSEPEDSYGSDDFTLTPPIVEAAGKLKRKISDPTLPDSCAKRIPF